MHQEGIIKEVTLSQKKEKKKDSFLLQRYGERDKKIILRRQDDWSKGGV